MPLRVCIPCERLYLFEEETRGADVRCPHCAGTISQRPVRSMRDLPLFRLELVSGRSRSISLVEGSARIPA